jgi:hypothetical protein
MDRRTRREHFSSAAFSIADDLLHRNILLLRATALNRYAIVEAVGSSVSALTRIEIVDSGAGCPVLKIEVSSTSSKTGVSHEYAYRHPAAPADDRGHERAQALRGHAEGPHPQLQAVCRIPEAIA